jgi:mono/diheme cytochrome c family protein
VNRDCRRETGDGRREGSLPSLAGVSFLSIVCSWRGARALCLVPLLSLSACEWFTDFKRQPMVTTWEQDSVLKSVRGAPQQSVPRGGTAVAGFQVSYLPAPGVIDSIGALATNPTPPSEASLANGHKYYDLNCAVCHGEKGAGDGAVTKYGMPAISIVTDMTKNRSDGYLFGMIRNGRGLMPSYNRIEEPDRWDVVNYVRALQGRITGVTFKTGPLAKPGVTGEMLPGATRLGPQRWVPHVSPSMIGTGAARQGAPSEVPKTDSTTRDPSPGARE